MLCPTCHGRRLFLYQGQLVPCPECNGQGEIHCCDGLQEPPNETPDTDEPDKDGAETDAQATDSGPK